MISPNAIELSISPKQLEIYRAPQNKKIISGGRSAGKTTLAVLLSTLALLETTSPVDGIVARADFSSLANTLYNEFKVLISNLGEIIENTFIFKKNPLCIQRKDNGATVYFVGYGGSDFSRTKGLKPLNPISFVIFDEVQELNDKRSLDEAEASFRRNFGENWKEYILFNPPPMMAHWINIYYDECKKNANIGTFTLTYLDILDFINDADLEAILTDKITNYKHYEWMYLGIPSNGEGSVYPMFDIKKHRISPTEYNALLLSGLNVIGVVIGVDGAVTHDATALVPLFILKNGQCVVPEVFYYDPQKNGVIGDHQMVQTPIKLWFESLLKKYNLGENANYAGSVPIYMRVDSASANLIRELQFMFGDRCDIAKINKGTIVEMVSAVQSALSINSVYIIENYSQYNRFEQRDYKRDMNILVEQINRLVWNDKQTGYDPSVPNDVCDAFTYACYFWYKNIENINWFYTIQQNGVKYDRISKIIGR